MDQEKTVTAKIWILKIIGNGWMCPFDRQRWSVIKTKTFFCLSGVKTTDPTHILTREPFQRHKWFSSVLSILEALWRSELWTPSDSECWRPQRGSADEQSSILLMIGSVIGSRIHAITWCTLLYVNVCAYFLLFVCLQTVITHLIIKEIAWSSARLNSLASPLLHRHAPTCKDYIKQQNILCRGHADLYHVITWVFNKSATGWAKTWHKFLSLEPKNV